MVGGENNDKQGDKKMKVFKLINILERFDDNADVFIEYYVDDELGIQRESDNVKCISYLCESNIIKISSCDDEI